MIDTPDHMSKDKLDPGKIDGVNKTKTRVWTHSWVSGGNILLPSSPCHPGVVNSGSSHTQNKDVRWGLSTS